MTAPPPVGGEVDGLGPSAKTPIPGQTEGAVAAALLAALERFLWWGQQQCPCYNDDPNPCPLCGASIENLEGCKAVEAKFPPAILGQAREAIARAKQTARMTTPALTDTQLDREQ